MAEAEEQQQQQQEGPIAALVAAAERVLPLPSPLADGEARAFLQQHPLESVFSRLSGHAVDDKQLQAICAALSKVLAAPAGAALLPGATGLARAALASPHARLRRLGAEQLGRALLLLPPPTASQEGQQEQELQGALVAALRDDADTGVASEAERALAAHAAARPAAFAALLGGGALRDMADAADATRRMRAFALLVAAAAGSAANAQRLRESGVFAKLLQQLSPADPLSCLVALQLLEELVNHVVIVGSGGGGGGDAAAPSGSSSSSSSVSGRHAAAQLLEQLLLPALLPLLDDPTTAAGALPIAARLVAAAETGSGPAAGAASPATAAMDVDGAPQANGGAPQANGGAPPPLLHQQANGGGVPAAASAAAGALLRRILAALDDAGGAGADEEVTALDAAGQLAQPSSAAAALVALHDGDGALLGLVCARALGRAAAAHPSVRVAALHALASVAGVERAGEARDRTAALMPRPAEDALRAACYGAVTSAAGGAGGARTPAEAVLRLLQQPFDDTRAAVYRCCAALALRPWFAADALGNGALLARLCDAASESGQGACEWRHATVMALRASAEYVLSLPDSAPDSRFRAALAPAAQQQLAAAARGGPYGAGAAGGAAGAAGRQTSQFVATMPR